MDLFDPSKIRRPKIRLDPPSGAVETFPIDLAGILALVDISELLEVPVPETANQLAALDSWTTMHWGSAENAELLAWLPRLIADSSITTIRVELDLPDGGKLIISRDVRQEWNKLHDWLARSSA